MDYHCRAVEIYSTRFTISISSHYQLLCLASLSYLLFCASWQFFCQPVQAVEQSISRGGATRCSSGSVSNREHIHKK